MDSAQEIREQDSSTEQTTDGTDETDMGNCINAERAESKPPPGLPMVIDKWYQDLLTKTVENSPDHATKYAAIVTWPDAQVLAVYPDKFIPCEKGVKDIIAGLQGKTAAIAADGLMLGPGCNQGVPGKLDAGKAIYGTDGKEGGTDAFRSDKSLLIGCYFARPAASTRLLRKTAQYMQDQRK